MGASVTRLILEGGLRSVLGKHKMERDITNLSEHYIICGYGRVGRVVCQELAKARAPFVVVDNSQAMEERIEADGHLVWRGDATEEETLPAKDLCPAVFILARAISDHGDRRLKAAGADRVVSPNLIGGYRMAHSVLHPSVMEFIDVVSEHAEMEELQLQEVEVPEDSSLAGLSIGESDIRRRFELLVVGRVSSDGTVAFNPAPTDTIEAGSMLIVLGHRANLDRFAETISTRPTRSKLAAVCSTAFLGYSYNPPLRGFMCVITE